MDCDPLQGEARLARPCIGGPLRTVRSSRRKKEYVQDEKNAARERGAAASATGS